MSLLLLVVSIVVFFKGSEDLGFRRHRTVFIKLNKCLFRDLSSSSEDSSTMLGYVVTQDKDYLELQQCTVSQGECKECAEISRVKYVKNEFIKNFLTPITNIGNSLRILDIGYMPELENEEYAIAHYDGKTSCSDRQSDGINFVEYSGEEPPYSYNCVDYGSYSKRCSCENKEVMCQTYHESGSSCTETPSTPLVSCEDYANVGICSNDDLNPSSENYDGIIADFSEDLWYPAPCEFYQGPACTAITNTDSVFVFKDCQNADCKTDCSITIKNEYEMKKNTIQQIYYSRETGGYFYALQNDKFNVYPGEQSYTGNGGYDEVFDTAIVGGFPQESYFYTYNRASYDDCFPLLGTSPQTYDRRQCFSDGVSQLTEYTDSKCTQVKDIRNLTQLVCGRVEIPSPNNDIKNGGTFDYIVLIIVMICLLLLLACCYCSCACCVLLCGVCSSCLLLLGTSGASYGGVSLWKIRRENAITYDRL